MVSPHIYIYKSEASGGQSAGRRIYILPIIAIIALAIMEKRLSPFSSIIAMDIAVIIASKTAEDERTIYAQL